jgi:hypothetical protein
MRAIVTALTLVSVLLLLDHETANSLGPTSLAQQPDHIAQVDKRPELSIPILDTARFKVASRKTTYHIGEMIDVDLAILNTSDRRVYFRRLSNAEVFLSKANHRKEKSVDYIMTEVTPIPETYALLDTHEMFSATYRLLAGCDQRAFQQVRAQLATTESRIVFEKELFLNWGDSCLQIRRPGIYSLTFAVSNWFVVVPSSPTGFQTAVGTLESKPLTITITK